jgi:tetratricopeptide (TPR) repeat protein
MWPLVLTLLVAAEPTDAAAKAAATEARLAYERHDFERSLAKYTEALALKPAPRLFFNLGQCHRQLGHHELAITFFQRYLETDPPELEQAAATRQLIADERLVLSRAETARLLELTHRQLELEAALRQPATPTPITQRWWFWAAIGVTVTAGATTAIVLATGATRTPTTFPDLNAR